jgi:uncharacterized Zn finger protein (UPF0148 family)
MIQTGWYNASDGLAPTCSDCGAPLVYSHYGGLSCSVCLNKKNIADTQSFASLGIGDSRNIERIAIALERIADCLEADKQEGVIRG